MQFLANALPGFRDLRAPVVAGYLWLVFAWLLVDPNLDRPPERGLGLALFHLGDRVGHAGLIIAASVTAYLVGSASQVVADLVKNFFYELLGLTYLGETARVDIEQLSREAVANLNAIEPRGGDRRRRLLDQIGQQAARASQGVHEELRLPATLLVGNQPALFSEVDRLRAEGELRMAVTPPMLALTVLAATSSLWWLFAAPVLVVLFFQGVTLERRSRLLIANAISQGLVESQSIDRFRKWARSAAVQDLGSAPAEEGLITP